MDLYRNTKTGVVFVGNGYLENGPDMVPYIPKEAPAEPVTEPAVEPADDGLDEMTKDQLEEFARDMFGVDIDKRFSLAKLREQVRAMMADA